jgi:hypothetical protein
MMAAFLIFLKAMEARNALNCNCFSVLFYASVAIYKKMGRALTWPIVIKWILLSTFSFTKQCELSWVVFA